MYCRQPSPATFPRSPSGEGLGEGLGTSSQGPGKVGEGPSGLSGIIDQKLPPDHGGRSFKPSSPPKSPQTLVWGSGEGRGKDPEITPDARKLLDWISARGRVTLSQVLNLGPPEYRRLRRLCLAELVQGDYIKRVDGWFEPAPGFSQERR